MDVALQVEFRQYVFECVGSNSVGSGEYDRMSEVEMALAGEFGLWIGWVAWLSTFCLGGH